MQQYRDNKLQNFVAMANKEHKNTSQSLVKIFNIKLTYNWHQSRIMTQHDS